MMNSVGQLVRDVCYGRHDELLALGGLSVDNGGGKDSGAIQAIGKSTGLLLFP